MSEVRVHVRLGTLRLDFQGDQSFYESHVESLVAAAAARGVRGTGAVGVARSARGNGSLGGAGRAQVAADDAPTQASAASEPSAASEGTAPPAATAEAADPYAPGSPEFGRFLRRLGAEADAPDLHILAFGFYLWNYERLETFGLPEIAGCLRAIGRELPTEVDEIMADLTERRRFLESAGPGRWRLGKKGENYVKTRLLTV